MRVVTQQVWHHKIAEEKNSKVGASSVNQQIDPCAGRNEYTGTTNAHNFQFRGIKRFHIEFLGRSVFVFNSLLVIRSNSE